MKEDPQEMLICTLECLLMPNGEVIVAGKTVGWFKEVGKYLTPIRHADGSPVEDGEYK